MRPKPLLSLLNSIKNQTLYPNEILIIDGSIGDKTQKSLEDNKYKNINYFKVDEDNRGLTKQRNFGIDNVSNQSQVVCFLDDDVVLDKSYFEHLLNTYTKYPKALGVGGYITNEVNWQKKVKPLSSKKFYYDEWERLEPLRFRVRKIFGVNPNTSPGYLPNFSHGRSISFLPPSGEIYKVQQLMGGVSSFKKEVFDKVKFSTYFEGYGLYEDADFTIRVSQLGQLYVNTLAQLEHHHDSSGRPNKFKYGKMVARNGWYVWRVAYPKPSFTAKLKWHFTFILLLKLRMLNIIGSKNKLEVITESLGRCFGWITLFFYKPKVR